MKKNIPILFITFLLVVCSWVCLRGLTATDGLLHDPDDRLLLDKGWMVESSSKVKKCGKVVSSCEFVPEGWYPAAIPSTVLSILVENNVFPDPYYGENMRSIPKKIFRKPWWYRTEFQLPAGYEGKKVWLHLDGIIYKADIWLNGHLVADSKTAEGVYRLFKFDVTGWVLPGATNYLALKVFPAKDGDLSVGFVDWNPRPADENTGIWQDVYFRATGPGIIEDPCVITDLDLPSCETARLTVSAEVSNTGGEAFKGTLEGRIENIRFSRDIELAPGETRIITFTPSEFKQLNISGPRLWWPNMTGPQNMYGLELVLKSKDEVSDVKKVSFGIREVSSYFNSEGYRGFKINGKNILIRGGGWTDDLMLRHSDKVVEAKVKYAKQMNLNTIRVEGIWGKDFLYDMCDKYGIMVLAGWTCHWEWEHHLGSLCDEFGGIYDSHRMGLAVDYWKEQVLRLRNHPCIFAWMYGSDMPPRPELEKRYIKVLDACDKTRPYVSSAAAIKSEVTGDTGVKMNGPYDYVPPFYYYLNKDAGGAFGFATEEGPGAVIPRVESMRRMLPQDKLWPIGRAWFYHSSARPRDLKVNTAKVEAQYGAAAGVEDYCRKSQLMNYDAARGLFEAWARNKYLSTGLIAWMFNSSWPSVCWQLFDAYLLPGGAFYGVQKACEPLHVQYSYDDNSVCVINGYYRDFSNLKVTARIFNTDLTRKYSNTAEIDVSEDSSNRAFIIEMPEGLTPAYFLKLELRDSSDKLVSSNFYCLSSYSTMGYGRDSELKKLEYFREEDAPSPFAGDVDFSYESLSDFTSLEELPAVEVEVSYKIENKGNERVALVLVENPSDKLAFFIQLDIIRGPEGEPVVPVFWEENYFSLLPGEKRKVSAVFKEEDLEGELPFVKVGGWNLITKTIKQEN